MAQSTAAATVVPKVSAYRSVAVPLAAAETLRVCNCDSEDAAEVDRADPEGLGLLNRPDGQLTAGIASRRRRGELWKMLPPPLLGEFGRPWCSERDLPQPGPQIER